MANNPIDINSFQHFLLIRGAEYEIIEPVNFDKSNFKCEQDNYARDTFYGNENDLLEFYQNYGSQGGTFMNNDGVLITHLPSGLDLLLQENRDNGSESDVKYILKKDGIEFTTGNFDFTTAETDNVTYFKSKVIQNTNQSKIKKREKLNIDLLATKDLDDNTISTIPIQRMLLKAKPLYGESEFGCPDVYSENLQATSSDNPFGETSSIFFFYNNCQAVIKFDIDDTLSFLSQTSIHNGNTGDDWEYRNDEGDNFGILKSVNDLSNISINIKNFILNQVGDADNGGNGYADTKFILRWGYDINYPLGEQILLSNSIDENQSITQTINDSTYIIPFVPAGGKVWLYLRTKVRQSATSVGSDARMECFTNVSKYNIYIKATSTAISSVVNAVRWIDLIKQNYKAIGSLPVNAPKFDIGGEFYDNFCFSKNLIKQELTKPFNVKLSDTIESLEEVNADAQINSTEIYVGQYTDFYRNIDMGGFLVKPDIESTFTKNERYLVNEFNFGYEKYEQDRSERNTIDSIHTNSQWFPQVQNSINTKEIKLPFIRDPFITEVARRMSFSSDNSSTNEDENIFIADVIQLPPNSKETIIRFLKYQSNGNGELKILAGKSFSWDLLGFNVGDTIKVNGTNRIVLEIQKSILRVTSTDFSGVVNNYEIRLEIEYPLTNVLYVNRTNEGLIFSDNLRNADNFSNLRYSIKRNLKHWFPNLATYGKFILNKKIKNTFFKSNGEATTQFIGESLPIKENEDILLSDIANYKIVNQDVFKTIVECNFQQGVKLLNDIQNVRGFIRVQSPDGSIIKGYVKESNNIWSLNELELELECKNESDFLTINYSGGLLTINEVGYDAKVTNIKLYNIFNDYIQFFDTNNVNLCNRTKFDKVLLNGISYTSVTDLVNAIELL